MKERDLFTKRLEKLIKGIRKDKNKKLLILKELFGAPENVDPEAFDTYILGCWLTKGYQEHDRWIIEMLVKDIINK